MNVTRINEFQSAEEKTEELFDFLKSLIPYISSSEGCISCEVLRSSENPDKFVVLEKLESIEFHKKSIDQFPKEKMPGSMKLFGAPPKGEYYYV